MLAYLEKQRRERTRDAQIAGGREENPFFAGDMLRIVDVKFDSSRRAVGVPGDAGSDVASEILPERAVSHCFIPIVASQYDKSASWEWGSGSALLTSSSRDERD